MSEEKKEKETKIEVPKKFKDIVEKIEKMSVLDLSELVKILEEKFGVKAQAPVMVQTSVSETEKQEAEEKSEFDVELTEVGGNKIAVIKAVREITDLGLKDAKDLVESAPKIVKEKVSKQEAEEIKKKLESAGAKVTLK